MDSHIKSGPLFALASTPLLMALFSNDSVSYSVSELKHGFLDAIHQGHAALEDFRRAFESFSRQALDQAPMLEDRTIESVLCLADLVERISFDLLQTDSASQSIHDDFSRELMDILDPAMGSLSLDCQTMSEGRCKCCRSLLVPQLTYCSVFSR